MAAGASNSAIAAELWITQQTVKFHLSNVYRKLGVANRTQASRYAHVHGLLPRRRKGAGRATAWRHRSPWRHDARKQRNGRQGTHGERVPGAR